MAQEIGSDHLVVLGEAGHHIAPGAGAGGDAVDQQDGRALAGAVVGDRLAVELDGLSLHPMDYSSVTFAPSCTEPSSRSAAGFSDPPVGIMGRDAHRNPNR